MGFWKCLGEFLFFNWLFGNHNHKSGSDNPNSLTHPENHHYGHDDLYSGGFDYWRHRHGHNTGHGHDYGFDNDYRSYDDFLDEQDDYDMMDDDF